MASGVVLFKLVVFADYIIFFLLLSSSQGWSLSDVMFVTNHNMANAVASVSKQLEHVSETLAVSRFRLPST